MVLLMLLLLLLELLLLLLLLLKRRVCIVMCIEGIIHGVGIGKHLLTARLNCRMIARIHWGCLWRVTNFGAVTAITGVFGPALSLVDDGVLIAIEACHFANITCPLGDFSTRHYFVSR